MPDEIFEEFEIHNQRGEDAPQELRDRFRDGINPTIPVNAVGYYLMIRIPDEEIAAWPKGSLPECLKVEIDNATAIVRRHCEAGGRKIESIEVCTPKRPNAVIEGDDFDGLQGYVYARFQRNTQEPSNAR